MEKGLGFSNFITQRFQFGGAILTVKRPQDENERFALASCDHLSQTSLSKRPNRFLCHGHIHATQHECENKEPQHCMIPAVHKLLSRA